MTAEDLPTTSLWMRLLRGGVSLTQFDRFLLQSLLQHVTDEMATAMQHQWRGCSLIQRDPEWQELRFYRLVRAEWIAASYPAFRFATAR